jgi:integrase
MEIIVTAIERRPGVWVLRWHGRHYHRDQRRVFHGDATAAEAARLAWAEHLTVHGPPVHVRSTTPLAEIIREQHRLSDQAPNTVALRERLLRLYIDPPIPGRRQDIGAARAAWGDVPGADLPGGGFPVDNPLGRRQIGRITGADGAAFQQHMIDRFSGRGGTRTIVEVMRLCMSALDWAVKQDAIPVNPWNGLKRLPSRKASVRVPTARSELVQALQARDDRTGFVIRLALMTGARRGEVLALRWRHIDLAKATMRIEASLDHRGGQFVLRPPKSESGRRVVPLPPAIIEEVRSWRATAAAYALAHGVPIGDVPVIQGDDGDFWPPATASQATRRALHAAGLPVSLHAMRHWHASTLLANRNSAETVRKQMGHGTITTTLRYYAHSMPGEAAAISATINEAVTSALESQPG